MGKAGCPLTSAGDLLAVSCLAAHLPWLGQSRLLPIFLLPLAPVGCPGSVLVTTVAVIPASMPQCVTPFQTSACIPLAEAGYIWGLASRDGAELPRRRKAPQGNMSKTREMRRDKYWEHFCKQQSAPPPFLPLSDTNAFTPSQAPRPEVTSNHRTGLKAQNLMVSIRSEYEASSPGDLCHEGQVVHPHTACGQC